MTEINLNSDIVLGNPHIRLRRLRQSGSIRALTQENTLTQNDFIYPIFISEEGNEPTPIAGLPDIYRIPFAALSKEIESILKVGIRSVMLFPAIAQNKKNASAQEALNPNGFTPRCIRHIKQSFPELLVFADVALDPYTSHGHDGLVDATGCVLNDETVHMLCHQSLVFAQSGVDYVCPSDMMDGRIGAIRSHLDKNGYSNTGILAYSVKFSSGLYGPFRAAVGSGSHALDKRTYQVNPANGREALREVLLDVSEGADIVMIKPALPYLDVVAQVREKILNPIAVYHVSGEYAMIKFAAQNKVIDEERVVFETLMSMKRAGANMIATYYAKWACERLLAASR